MNKSLNGSFYQSPPRKQATQTSRLNNSLMDFHTPNANTQPDEFEYYSVPKNFTTRISKRDRYPSHYGNELQTKISGSYNTMENSFYKYIRSISNQQRIYDDTTEKNDQKMIRLDQMISKCSNNKQQYNEKRQKVAKGFIQHSSDTKTKYLELTSDMLSLQSKQIEDLKKNQLNFINKKQEKQDVLFAVRIPQEQRMSYIRQKTRVQEENQQLDFNEENGERLKDRLSIVEQRYDQIMKDKKLRIQKSNEKFEKIKRIAEQREKNQNDYFINKLAKSMDNSVRQRQQVDLSLDKTLQKKKVTDVEKQNTVRDNRDTMSQTFVDKLHNCTCTSKTNSPRKYFKLGSRMSVDEKMLQVSLNKQYLKENRERYNQDLLDRHTQYSLTNSLSKTAGATMNNFRRRAMFLTKEEFKFKS